MSKPIRVRIMGRKYPLRVDASDEAYMRKIASFVDEKMQAVRDNFPGQPELTSAVIASLSIAEELIEERSKREQQETRVHGELTELIEEIDELVGENEQPAVEETSSEHSNGEEMG
jgi:cell division protein ZapA (FtsZ GTPase activity inhibitor)